MGDGYTTLTVVVETSTKELVLDGLARNEHVWFAGTETTGVSATALAAGAEPGDWP